MITGTAPLWTTVDFLCDDYVSNEESHFLAQPT